MADEKNWLVTDDRFGTDNGPFSEQQILDYADEHEIRIVKNIDGDLMIGNGGVTIARGLGQTELLQRFCAAHIGEHYKSTNLDNAPTHWDHHWPIINANGNLTGEVFESGDPNGDAYANVDDMAMILISDLPSSIQSEIERDKEDGYWDGYVSVSL